MKLMASNQPKSPSSTAAHIRRLLKDGGSAEHSAGVQWFFKEEIKSHGWYTDDLRKLAASLRRDILNDHDLDYLVHVADQLFQGNVIEEKGVAVLLLQKSVADFGNKEFKLFERWLSRVSSWADHDALVCYLIGEMIVADPKRLPHVFRWAKSKDRWHRRAAAVALLRGNRKQMFFDEIVRVSEMLLADKDDMVQKGLGWLLREAAKYNREKTVPYLMTIRDRSPRLVLRTACETLPEDLRTQVLGRTASSACGSGLPTQEKTPQRNIVTRIQSRGILLRRKF
jgi:3-methyladenine DNA glycosylase AlkD